MARYSKKSDDIELDIQLGKTNIVGIKDLNASSKFKGAFVYFAAAAAALNITAMALSSSYTSSTAQSLKSPKTGLKDISETEITWIASIVQITAIPGAILSGYLSNRLGRKAILMYNSVPFVISWLMVAYADSVTLIYAGRILTGCCAGIVTVAVPTYLTEISVPANRGRLGTLYTVAFAIGLLAAMSLGMVMTWRWIALFSAAVNTLSAFLLCFAPESPSWLISHNFKTKALRALKLLRGNSEEALTECNLAAEHLSRDQTRLRLFDFKDPVLYKPLLLGLGLVFFQQFNGVNALISYTEEIFEKARGSLSAKDATLVAGVIQVPIYIMSIMIIERAGRRVFHALSGTLMTIGLIAIGLFILLSNKDSSFGSNYGWMPLTGYVIFFVGFSLGYAPLPFIMITEMTPQHGRSIIVGISTVVIYLAAFTVTKTFEDFQRLLTSHGVYFMYAGITFCGVIFGLVFLPETKGKTLEEIQEFFSRKEVMPIKRSSFSQSASKL